MDEDERGSDVKAVLSRMAVAGLVALALAAGAISREAASAPTVRRPVAFVPLGSYPRSEAASLARYFARRLGLQTSVIPRIPLPKSALNLARKQFVAEELIDVVASGRPGADSQAVLIGLTVEDMYTRDRPDWRFSFSIRHLSGLAVVSRARMDPRVFGLTPDPALRMRRLQKMVLKNIGVLALGQYQSRNPRSVLYNSILSVDDLDYMTEEFAPAVPSTTKQNWLRRAASVCKRGVAEVKALVARSRVATPADFLTVARESITLEERTRTQLASIPAPSEDRGAIRAMLALFERGVRTDRAAVARLSARWSEARLRRWLQDGLRLSLALKSKALELGTRPCGRYFDPATYAR